MKYLQIFESYLSEAFKISDVSVNGKHISLKINGHEYKYKFTGNAEKGKKSFYGLYKHSPGKALSWLKKNSTLETGSVNKRYDKLFQGNVKKINESEINLKDSVALVRVGGSKKIIKI